MLADNIRKLRKERGLTQTELGEKLGFRHSTIAGYESGRTVPTGDVLEKIAKALGVGIAELYDGNSDPGNTPNITTIIKDKQMEMLIQQQELLAAQHKTIDKLVEIIGRDK